MTFPYRSIRHLLIDLDGVLYLGSTPLPDAAAFIDWLRYHAITFRLVSNNSTITPQQYVEKLQGMGIAVTVEEIFTSALATARYLSHQEGKPPTVYAVGEVGLHTALREAGMIITDESPNWVVVGLDRHFNYDKLTRASLAIQAGARYIATNPDTSLPTEHGLMPGAGSIQAAITAASGATPLIIGKPRPVMLDLAREQLNGAREDTAAIGDRLDTDIEGAIAAYLPSILVLTGVSRRQDLATCQYQPTLVVDHLADLMREWDSRLS